MEDPLPVRYPHNRRVLKGNQSLKNSDYPSKEDMALFQLFKVLIKAFK